MCCQCWILLLKHKSKIEAEFKEEFKGVEVLPELSDAISENGLCCVPPEDAAVIPSVLYLCLFDMSTHLICAAFCPEQKSGFSYA